MDGNIMKINGKRIVFKGVNRHEFDCYYGRAIPESKIAHDLDIMKLNNINAIRTSHYPNNSKLYELCDIYGFYVIDETNMETHGSWQIRGSVRCDKNTVPMIIHIGMKQYWIEQNPCLNAIKTMPVSLFGLAVMNLMVVKISMICLSTSVKLTHLV